MRDAEEPLCARCARSQKTCCQTREIYLTPGDRARIETHTGRSNFFRFAVAAPEYLEQDDDPEWLSIFRPDGSRRILERHETGDCTFLGKAGCSLPMEVRPLVCRLYPFDYTAAGLREELSEGCPTPLLAPGQTLISALDMRREVAEHWRAQLYAELALEAHDEDRPDLRSKV